jgi:YidC/Oxa1 family membrane protein insertase
MLSMIIAMGLSLLLDVIFPPSESEREIPLEQAQALAPSPPSSLITNNALWQEEEIPFETEVFKGVFSTKGASLVSLSFKNYLDEAGEQIELMAPRAEGAIGSLYHERIWVGQESLPAEAVYSFAPSEEGHFVFALPLEVAGQSLLLTKTYRFEETGYLFEVETQVTGSAALEVFADISFRESLMGYGHSDPTMVHAYTKKLVNVKKPQSLETQWTGATNRYLAMALIPPSPRPMTWNTEGEALGVSWREELSKGTGGDASSHFYVYLGPKDYSELSRYEKGSDNAFGLSDLALTSLVQGGWFSWLEELLALVLGFFYQVIPNWGVAIILLTILVKVLLYPAALKAHLSMANMQKVQPEMKALQEKHKEDPAKLQQEMQKIYQKHGVSPLGGCLPMLIQIPIFLALYGLLNNYLALRGAVFIPHWIIDLSLPEAVISFPFAVPFLEWTDLRLLPFVMLGTQFLSGWINMNNAQTATMSASQQKFLFYGMPTLFFFILYNMASGLLIYWIVNNILTVVQQIYLTRYLK